MLFASKRTIVAQHLLAIAYLVLFVGVFRTSRTVSEREARSGDVPTFHSDPGARPLQCGSCDRCNQPPGFTPIYVYHGDKTYTTVLRRKFGNEKFYGSQLHQDVIVLAIVKELDLNTKETNQSHFFIDLAANHAALISNTIRLEDAGWRGLCVEPNPMYWFNLAYRKCKVLGAFVGGYEDGVVVDVSLSNDAFGGIVSEGMDNKPNSSVITEQRSTVSFSTMMREFDVPSTIDYVSLDVEGAEEIVMENFPFDTYRIKIITIERPSSALQSNLRSHGYIFVQMIWYFGETIWVHESVMEILGMEKINLIIRNNHTPKRPKKGYHVFNMATGKTEVQS